LVYNNFGAKFFYYFAFLLTNLIAFGTPILFSYIGFTEGFDMQIDNIRKSIGKDLLIAFLVVFTLCFSLYAQYYCIRCALIGNRFWKSLNRKVDFDEYGITVISSEAKHKYSWAEAIEFKEYSDLQTYEIFVSSKSVFLFGDFSKGSQKLRNYIKKKYNKKILSPAKIAGCAVFRAKFGR